jgi:hypothetical protein
MRFYEYNIKKIKPNKPDSHGVILVTPESYRGTILVNDNEDPKLINFFYFKCLLYFCILKLKTWKSFWTQQK